MNQGPDDSGSARALSRRMFLTGVSGLITFAASSLLDGPLDVPLAQQLVLTVLVGSVTLVSQFLVNFDTRLGHLERATSIRIDMMERHQQHNAEEIRRELHQEFERISSATSFFALIEKSALQTEALIQLIQRSSQINGASPQLLRDLAHYEIERLTALMKSLSIGNEVFYDGEDREWLLGLASKVNRSIMATSLATVDAGGQGFEGGLWLNDLGSRYLDVQRAAVRRGVEIRRIFVFDKPDLIGGQDFFRIRHLQQDAGILVRVLDSTMVPEHLKNMVFDFILFDQVISYETQLASRIEPAVKPAFLTTRLILDEGRVKWRAERFEQLWTAAQVMD